VLESETFVDCNPAAVAMLDYPDKATLLSRFNGNGSHPWDISPPTQPDGRSSVEKAEAFLQLVSKRGTVTFEWTHLTYEGQPLELEVQLTQLQETPAPVVLVVWRTIAERKRLEADLRRSHRLEAAGRLAGGVAHEFNNLLTVLTQHIEELRTTSGPPSKDALNSMQAAAERASSLTAQLLSFSRGAPARVGSVNLKELVRGMAPVLRRLLGDVIELDLTFPDDALRTRADRNHLEQVVFNLVVNARDALRNGGKVEVRLERLSVSLVQPFAHLREGEYAVLRVVDNGMGMSASDSDRAFDPFFTTKTVGQGFGLGLAKVHAIAEQAGGTAVLETAIGIGTTVSVALPLSASLVTQPVATPTLGPEATEASRDAPKRILVVEDEHAVRTVMVRALRKKGYEVLEARHGMEALERVSDGGHIDLLISDVVMPHMTGPELVSKLRQTLPRMPVLFVTGFSNHALDDAHARVLQKPFSRRELLSQIQGILS